MPAQITLDGIQIQTTQEVLDELNAACRDPDEGFGPDFILDDGEIIPQYNGILAERFARVQALAKAVVDAMVPGAARGVHADNVANWTGTVRIGDTHSSVEVELSGTAGETIPAGRTFRHDPSETLWDTLVDVILDGGGLGTTTLRAQDTGPIEIVATVDWTIVVGDPELDAVESVSDSVPGQDEEDDDELEERRIAELATLGASTAKAIKANLQQSTTLFGGLPLGPQLGNVVVFVNNRPVTDADGRPPHSAEILIDDGGLVDDEVIAREIWDIGVAGGIRPYGAIEVSFVDEDGVDREAGFSRHEQILVWLRVTLTTTGAEVNIEDEVAAAEAIAAAVVVAGDAANTGAGRDVIPIQFIGPALAVLPTGSVVNVVVERSLDGVAWSTAVLPIGPLEIAAYDIARVLVLFV
jgi:hypothetical protein